MHFEHNLCSSVNDSLHRTMLNDVKVWSFKVRCFWWKNFSVGNFISFTFTNKINNFWKLHQKAMDISVSTIQPTSRTIFLINSTSTFRLHKQFPQFHFPHLYREIFLLQIEIYGSFAWYFRKKFLNSNGNILMKMLEIKKTLQLHQMLHKNQLN